MRVYELNQKQHELIDELYFLDDVEDAARIQEIELELSKINASAESTLEYLSNILLQMRYQESVAIDEVKRLQELVKDADKRAKKRTANKERLTGVMVRICNDFNINAFSTQYADFKKSITPGAIITLPGFDIDKIPQHFVRVIPETKELNGNEVLALLRDTIKDAKGKLDPDAKTAVADQLPGLVLMRKESIK